MSHMAMSHMACHVQYQLEAHLIEQERDELTSAIPVEKKTLVIKH